MLLAGKYQAVRLMSNKGGFGDTYEVSKRGVSRVLKVLKSDNVKAVELFDREFRVLKNLTSQNVSGIPQVKDFFLYHPCSSHQALHCIVMERINGLDLEEYLKTRKKPIDEKMAIDWISQLTDILQQVHNQGILHRDIKPSNIMLKPDGQLVLIDFGAAKEAAASIPGQSTLIYTPGYAAPEQHQTGRTSPKSDFFALGRTFVYLLTAAHPMELYDSYNDFLLWRHRSKNISPSFLDLIDRLMQEELHLRPKDVTEIIAAIADLSDNNLNLLPPANPDPNLFVPPVVSITQPPTVPAHQTSPITQPPTVPVYQPLSATQQPTVPTHQPLSITQQSAVPTIQPPLNIHTPTASASSPKSINKWILTLATLSILGISVSIIIGFRPNKNEKFTDIDSRNIPAGTFKVGGSTTWATTRQPQALINTAIQGAFSDFIVKYTDAPEVKNSKCSDKSGSNAGICLLIEGDLDIVQSSVSLADPRHAGEAQEHKLKEEAIAYDALSVVVNPNLEITNLTIDQLRNIYSGNVNNWNQVGGPNIPIEPFSRNEETAGSVSVFKDLVLLGKSMGSQVIPVNGTTQGLNRVKNSKGGIYFGAAKEVIVDFCGAKPLAINSIKPYLEPLKTANNCSDSNRNKINKDVIRSKEYPLIRKIYIVIKADESKKQKAGEAYAKLLLTKQGQEILEEAGFVGINK